MGLDTAPVAERLVTPRSLSKEHQAQGSAPRVPVTHNCGLMDITERTGPVPKIRAPLL